MPNERRIAKIMLCVWFLSIPFSATMAAGESTLAKENDTRPSEQELLPGLSEPQDTGPLNRDEKLKRAKFYYAAGESYIKQGNFVAADEAFKKAQAVLQETASEKNAPETAQKTEGGGKDVQGQTTEPAKPVARGVDEYLAMLQKKPYSSDIYYNLALEYLKMNQFSDAAESFKKVIALNPKDYEAYYNLGVLYEHYLRDKLRAMSYYQTYLKFAPKGEDAEKVKMWIKEISAVEPTLK
jgi:tetratricopeptide (TPR) repeat protein